MLFSLLTAWEELVSVKESEVSNLQTALGELTYESEAVERMRLEVGKPRSYHCSGQTLMRNGTRGSAVRSVCGLNRVPRNDWCCCSRGVDVGGRGCKKQKKTKKTKGRKRGKKRL